MLIFNGMQQMRFLYKQRLQKWSLLLLVASCHLMAPPFHQPPYTSIFYVQGNQLVIRFNMLPPRIQTSSGKVDVYVFYQNAPCSIPCSYETFQTAISAGDCVVYRQQTIEHTQSSTSALHPQRFERHITLNIRATDRGEKIAHVIINQPTTSAAQWIMPNYTGQLPS